LLAGTLHRDAGAYREPMLVRWSAFPSQQRFNFGWPCPSVQDPTAHQRWTLAWNDFLRSTLQTFRSVVLRGQRLECHYIDEVLATTVVENRPRIESFITGRVVLIGAASTMTQHWVRSPVNGEVPGVILHAAATENLLGLGADYARDMNSSAALFLQLIVVLLVASIVISTEKFAVNRKPARWMSDRIRGRIIAACIALAFILLVLDTAAAWKTALVLFLIGLAWMLHAPIELPIAVFCFLIGGLVMVAFLDAGIVPIDWIGVLAAGVTSAIGDQESGVSSPGSQQ